MTEKDMQQQINDINTKLDLLIGYVNDQRLKSEALNDFMADASIIGKDIFDGTVSTLEDQQITINPEGLKMLGIRFLKNVDNFHQVFGTFESLFDFLKDAAPIGNEVMVDAIKFMHQLEEKGYFEFMKSFANVIDNVITHFSKEDIESLADNVVTIMETVKAITQPDMMKTINNGIQVFKSLDVENVPSMSVWKLMRELRSPEMKKGMGFMVTFLKNVSKQENNNIN